MKLRSGSVFLLLVLGCSAGGGPEGPPSADASGAAANGSGGQQGVIPGSGGTDIVVPEDQFSEEDCDNVLPIMYRDFSSTHPDFEMNFAGDVVRRGLVAPDLGTDRKPVFASTIGCPWLQTTPLDCDNWDATNPEITSQETFDQWYRSVPDVNYPFEDELTLAEDPPGSGTYVYDTAAFFPLATTQGFGESFQSNSGTQENFHFTTEIHLQFAYVAGQKFTFRGDDDLWIFVNGKLALDLGGMHMPAEGTIDFDAQAVQLGISPNNPYSMDIFHAERHTRDSNFRIETNISCFVPVEIY